MIVCPACGRPTELSWTACLNCGKTLNHPRVQPGQVLPPKEQPVAPQPQAAQPQPQPMPPQYHPPQPQYYQPIYQQPVYQKPRKSCLGRFIGALLLLAFLWWIFVHFIPAMSDLHLLFESDYVTPQEVGAWFARLNPFG